MTISICDADLNDPLHCSGLLDVLDEYARLPHIAGQGLADSVRRILVESLSEHPGKHVLVAIADGRVVGVAICFLGFSTFAGLPLLNLHDLAVRAEARGRGIGTQLLAAVDQRARELGCCRVTLEVSPSNEAAKRLYQRSGYRMAQQFWKKELD